MSSNEISPSEEAVEPTEPAAELTESAAEPTAAAEPTEATEPTEAAEATELGATTDAEQASDAPSEAVARIAEQVAALDTIGDVPLAEHAEIYQRLHAELQTLLSDIDGP